MTGLCPFRAFFAPQDCRVQTLVQRAWQRIHVVVRWLPGRVVVCVADRRDAALAGLHQVRTWRCASLITHLRPDVALNDPPPTREAGQPERPRLKGARPPTLEAILAAEDTLWNQLTMAQ
jgi:hypothetical protein